MFTRPTNSGGLGITTNNPEEAVFTGLLTLDVQQAYGELPQLWYFLEHFVGDQVDPAVLWPKLYFPLDPRRANLYSPAGGSHVGALTGDGVT